MLVIETNIDDMNPQFYDHVMERLFAAGARDVFLAPIQMKKNRPATLLSVICRAAERDQLARIILHETSTIGIRYYPVSRISLDARIEKSKNPLRRSHGENRRAAGRQQAGHAGIRRPETDRRRQETSPHQTSFTTKSCGSSGS